MAGTPGSGPRRDKDGLSSTAPQKTPRHGLTTNKTTTNGRSTPVRGGRPGESTFIHANAAWGYETPAHKILTNIPSSVTVRSSERKRRVKADGSDDPTSSDRPLSSNFIESRYVKVRSPTPDVPSRTHVRSNSNTSIVSDRGTQKPRRLSKASSFSSGGGSFGAPSTNKENFFHAKEVIERPSSQLDISEKFFTADKAKSPSPLLSTNISRQRRLSTSSQFSSFTSAKETCPSNYPPYSIPPLPNPSSQPRSPGSPTKSTFCHSNSSPPSISPLSNPTQRNNPPSPLRSNFITAKTPSPPPEPPSKTRPSPKPSPPAESNLSSSSSSINPIEINSDTSKDEITSKSLVPTSLDLENSARINRKIADLEISNSSLLAVNQNLERTTRQQALEIRALKRQLRQSLRLSIVPNPISPVEDSASEEEEEEDGEDDDGTAADTDFRLRLDKCVFLSEQMLVEGRRGLDYRVTASELVTGRVISGDWKEQEKAVEVMA